jgi:predicted DNA-binding transcriptional regulator AlpA
MSLVAQMPLFPSSPEEKELGNSIEKISPPKNTDTPLPPMRPAKVKSVANLHSRSSPSKPQSGSSRVSAAEEERYLSVRDVADRYAISIQTVWRHTKHNPDFPKPIKILTGSTRWRVSEILAYEATRQGADQ